VTDTEPPTQGAQTGGSSQAHLHVTSETEQVDPSGEVDEEMTPEASRAGVTLAHLLDQIPAYLLRLVISPSGTEVLVSGPSIQDPLEHVAPAAGEIVLAVGTPPGSADALRTIRSAAQRGASAVLFRTDDDVPPGTIAAASEAGIALVSAAASVTWSHIHGLVRIVCLSDGLAHSEDDDFGIPTGDLFGLADSVATMAKGAVTIEDIQHRVIAYSNTGEPIDEQRRIAILGRRLPQRNIELLRAAGIFKGLWQTRDVVHVGDVGIDGSMSPRLAIGVFAGDEPLGSIWVAEGETPLGEAAKDALRRAARPAALHLLKSRYASDASRRQRSDVLRRMLDGQAPPESLTRSVGLDPAARHAVIAVELEPGHDVDLAVQSDRVLTLVGVYYQALGRKSAETVVGRTVYTLVPLSRRQAETESDALSQLRNGALKHLNFKVKVAVGTAVDNFDRVVDSRRDADLVQRLGSAR
jgi:hypothetical protein